MATRSDIIVKRTDGQWARIYCHWDGYPEGVGKTLFEHYKTQEKCEALIALGDLSSLGEEIGEKHDFNWQGKYRNNRDHPEAQRLAVVCLFYGRDRGESDTEAKIFDNIHAAWPDADTGTEFTYVFADGKWWIGDPDESSETVLELGDVLSGK
jgi:hypothetical protein